MKKTLFTILFSCVIVVSAFGIDKVDSIYYLLDTSKTQLNDRLWDIHEEYPSIKVYTINCPCLPYNNLPTFIENTGTSKQEIITKKELPDLKLVTLATLIAKAKQFAIDNAIKGKVSFFLIEPIGNKFIVHHVRLHIINKPREPNNDYIILPRRDSTK